MTQVEFKQGMKKLKAAKKELKAERERSRELEEKAENILEMLRYEEILKERREGLEQELKENKIKEAGEEIKGQDDE